MSAFEERLRYEMQETASAIEPRPLDDRSRSRARIRQAGLALASLFVLAGAATAAAGALGVFEEPAPAPVTGTEEDLDPRGSGGIYPCEQPGLDGHCIATGEWDGHRWAIGAELDGDELCTSDWEPGGAGGGCGPFEETELGLGISTAGPSPEYGFAYGQVPVGTAKVFLERDDGTEIELELYPAPPELGAELDFYAVFLPLDAKRIAAYDGDGQVVATQDISDDWMRPGDFSDNVEPETILKGESEGVRWELQAHETGAEAPCVGLNYVTGSLGTALGSCPKVKNDRPFGYQLGAFARGTGRIVVYGWITAAVDHLTIETRTGRELGYIVEAPEGFDDDYRFFVALPPAPRKGPVKAVFLGYDAAGNLIEETPLCRGYKLSSQGTCGR